MKRMSPVLCALLLLGCGTPEGKPAGNNTTSNNTTSNNTASNNTTANNTTSNSTTGNNGSTDCSIKEPEFHRAEHASCNSERPAGNTVEPPDPNSACNSDADCTEGENGRCLEEFRSATYYCSYDQCFGDDDCGGGACICGNDEFNIPNGCIPGNCVTDADCAATSFCSPTQGSCGAYEGTVGYFCHTCEDECVTDADCGGDPYTTYCAYDVGVGHWRCSDAQCAG